MTFAVDPCGYAVDMIRHGGDWRMKGYRDRRGTVVVRWARVPFGTPGLPIPHTFAHTAAWAPWRPFDNPSDGQAGELLPKVRKGPARIPRFYRTPRHYCGSAEAWLNGGGPGDRPLVFTPLGYSTCCLGVPGETFGQGGAAGGGPGIADLVVIRGAGGGLLLGGGADLVELAGGGLLLGGGADEVLVAGGGLLLGGGADLVELAGGGLLLGGGAAQGELAGGGLLLGGGADQAVIPDVCGGCTGLPVSIPLPLSGFAGFMDDMNGDWVLDYISGCVWSGPASDFWTAILNVNGDPYTLTLQFNSGINQALYELAADDWTCSGDQVFTYVSQVGPGTAPGTVTVTLP